MNKNKNLTGIIIGVVLVVLGFLSIFKRYIFLPNMDSLWPLIVVGVGIAFFIPILLGNKTKGNLAIPGSIITMIGIIVFFMNRSDNWEAWSYCWALIVCAVGAGNWINGYVSGKPDIQKKGLTILRTGLLLFITFGVIMEFIFSQSGEAHWGGVLLWSILLILVGTYLLITRILRIKKADGEQIDLFWPVMMIGLGFTAAISNLTGMPGLTFGRLINILPLLLIAAGIGLIFRNRSAWFGLILGVLIVAGFFVIVFAGGSLGMDTGWLSYIDPFDFGDSDQRLVASCNTISVNRPVSGLERVNVESSVDLVIQQGPTESLVITGDEAILPALLTNTTLGQMTIRYDPLYDIRSTVRPKLVLTVTNLNELRVGSSSKITVESLSTGNFNLIISSSCDVNFKGLQAEKVSVRLSSSADIFMEGEADSLDLDVSSSVNFQAGGLEVQNATVTMTSSADVTLWVVGELTVNMSSSGNLSYFGNPVVHQNISGSGRLIPKGEK